MNITILENHIYHGFCDDSILHHCARKVNIFRCKTMRKSHRKLKEILMPAPLFIFVILRYNVVKKQAERKIKKWQPFSSVTMKKTSFPR